MTDYAPAKLTPPPNGSALLRENLFEENAGEDEGELLKRREPTMLRKGKKLVAPPSDGTRKKYTVVFDLDETVVYARDGPLYARAYLKDLFRSIKDDFEVIVWTAGERDYAKRVLEEINEDHIIQHLVYRHKKWFHEEDYTKDLRQLGRDLDYTIMIENTPDCVRANPQNGIIVEDFEVLPEVSEDDGSPSVTPTATPAPAPVPVQESAPTTAAASEKKNSNDEPHFAKEKEDPQPERAENGASAHAVSPAAIPPSTEDGSPIAPQRLRRPTDRTLYLLREVLASLVKSSDTVPHFLSTCELLSRQTVLGSDGNEIPIYHLGMRRRRKDAGVSRKVVKQNRDKCCEASPVAPAPTENEVKDADEAPLLPDDTDDDALFPPAHKARKIGAEECAPKAAAPPPSP